MQVWGAEEAKRAYDPIGEEIWDLAVDPDGFVYTARDRDITVWILKGIVFNLGQSKNGKSLICFGRKQLVPPSQIDFTRQGSDVHG